MFQMLSDEKGCASGSRVAPKPQAPASPGGCPPPEPVELPAADAPPEPLLDAPVLDPLPEVELEPAGDLAPPAPAVEASGFDAQPSSATRLATINDV
jgi:hypothetical protein